MPDGRTEPLGLSAAADLRRRLLADGLLPREWMGKSDLYGWLIAARVLLPFFGIIIAMPIAASFSPLYCFPLALLWGVYSYKISFIMHDCGHDTLFRTRRLNGLVGLLCGWLVVADFQQFKRLHGHHHRYNGTDRDPQWGETGGLERASRARILRHLVNALVGQRLGDYFGGYLSGAAASPSATRSGLISALAGIAVAQASIAVVVTGFGQFPWLVLAYPISAATISLFLARLRTFAEHIEPDGRPLRDFARTHRPRWFDAFLLYDAHFNYHLEHHIFPQVPSRHLPRFHSEYAHLLHSELTLSSSMLGTIWGRLREARS